MTSSPLHHRPVRIPGAPCSEGNGRARADLRVLHLTEAAGSGTLQVVLTLAGGVAVQGHAVAVAYGQRPETPDDLVQTMPHGVLGVALPWDARTPAAQIRAARALRRFMASFRPDVVHLHSTFAGVLGTLALPHEVPCVYTPHGYSFDRPGAALRHAYRASQQLVARRCVVGAVSEAEGELARDVALARRVRIVPNGILELDPAAFAPPVAATRHGVVAMGRIVAERRPAETADILASIARHTPVAWIGAAPAGQDAPLRAAGIPVTGWLGRDAAITRLARAQAYLHWSASDGLSLSILEALAADVVVVASDIPANREVVGPRQVCASPADAAELLRAVIERPALRAELLADQRRRRTRFSAETMIAGWTDVYRELHEADRASSRRRGLPKIEASWS